MGFQARERGRTPAQEKREAVRLARSWFFANFRRSPICGRGPMQKLAKDKLNRPAFRALLYRWFAIKTHHCLLEILTKMVIALMLLALVL